jgi:succinate-semialdehyde dehydrogenase/glutarate-semialdehyde dehydrogenase
MPIRSINPANGQVLREFAALTPEALEAKLALAADAARSYPDETLAQRAFWMRRLTLLLAEDAEDLAALMTAEMGKTLDAARTEIRKCAAACRYYTEHAESILAPEPVETEHAESYVRWDPLGVVLAVMPWNFPLWQVFRFLAPALMAGNVGLLKHASNVPQCSLAIEALVRRAGFPRGVFQALLIEARQVEMVLADERVAAVTVTGSEAAGRAIAAQAGWLIKKSVLELGGSDAFIVMPSAELEEAAANAVKARCINNGQSCIAAKRFLVHTDVYDAFEKLFVAGMEALRVGDPTKPDTDLGPLATAQIVQELMAQVRSAVGAGGRILTGGEPMVGDGHYFEPTVIAEVPRDAAVAAEETFGPLALLFRVESAEDAVALANATPFGLGASVWSADAAEQALFARQLQCGGVFINTPVASDPRLPFGGIKRSGYGRELSAAGMREFQNAKTVVVSGAHAQTRQEVLPFLESAHSEVESEADRHEASAEWQPAPVPAARTSEVDEPLPPRRRGFLQLD